MTDTGFALAPDRRALLVGMHARAEDGTLGTIPFELPPRAGIPNGGGGLYGTAADYLAFERLFLS
jgi:hypothetical protein